MAHPWPLFDLRVRTPRLELRLPTDDEVLDLVRVVDDGIHDPGEMPFSTPWTRLPPEERARGTMQWHWSQRASWTPARWNLLLAAFVDGTPVGAQDVGGSDFAALRVVSSGSWLGRRWQGSGLGTEMREAMLHLAFAGLGAEWAKSCYWEGNAASANVSAKAGYEPNGFSVMLSDNAPRRMERVIIGRERWSSRRRADISVEGLGPCLELFGLAPADPAAPIA